MARVQQGILGGFSGKIGNIVGSSWKGIAVMKTKPLSVANPKTAAQTAQRTDFKDAVDFAKVINSQIIKPLWDRFADRMSGFNDFISKNIGDIKPGSDLASKVKISTGQMAATAIDSATIDAGGNRLTISWTDDSGEGFKLADDDAYIVVFDDDCKVNAQSAGDLQRDSGGGNVPCVNLVVGKTYQVRLAFRRKDGTVVSETSYAEDTAS
jgi:hypothetical protein